MTKLHALLMTGLLVLAPGAWAQDVEKTIADLEQKWAEAELANNPALSAPLFAETAIFGGVDGTVKDKAAFVASEKATKYAEANLRDLKIMVYGDAAIASYIFHAKGTGADGKPFELTERATDTWVKMPGGLWKLVAAHGSMVKP